MINVIFDPGRGRVTEVFREAEVGSPLGELPVPKCRGYRFEGWYLGDRKIMSSDEAMGEDMRLVAKWSREKTADRKKSMLKKQKIALLALAVCAVILTVTLIAVLDLISIYTLEDTYVKDGVEYTDKYYIKKHGEEYKLFDREGNLMEVNTYVEGGNVYIAAISGNQYEIDPETGAYTLYHIVDTKGTEFNPGSGTTLLMYQQISATDVFSITVTHGDSETPAYRFLNEGNGVYIEGFEDSLVSYDENKFAYLAMACGYTITQMKLDPASDEFDLPILDNGKLDYALYGLDQPQAKFTICAIKDKNAKTYEADPDRTFTVLLGDRTLSAGGYYAMIDTSASSDVVKENADTVYILSNEFFDESVLCTLEQMIVPRATHPVSMNEHTMVQDFYLTYLETWIDDKEIQGTPVVAFDYEEMEYRENTMRTTTPFICDSSLLDGMSGYAINDSKASDALSALYNMQFVGCRALGIKNNPALLKEYGLDKNVFYLTYKTKTGKTGEDGKPLYAQNQLIIGAKTEAGTHYVASLAYDMILEVDQYHLSFLEWGHFEWYSQYFMSADIAHLQNLSFDFGDGKVYDFSFDNNLSYAYFVDSKQKYTFKSGDKILTDKNGDYWVSIDGGKPKQLKVVDFEGATRYTHTEADRNSGVGNILYNEDLFYYYDENKELVRITPDYEKGDEIMQKDGVYYYRPAKSDIVVSGNLTTGDLIYRFEKGHEIKLEFGSSALLVICDRYTDGGHENEHILDYVIDHTYINDNGVSVTEEVAAIDNFRNLYIQIIQYSLRGDIDPKEFQRNTGMTVEEFLSSDRAKTPDAAVTMETEDHAQILNNSVIYDEDGKVQKVHTENISRRLVFRFYRYSDMKAMVTVESMEKDEDGNWQPSDETLRGRFFVSASFLDKMEADAERVLDGELVNKATTY